MHKDHANCHKIVVDAAFLAAVYDGDKLEGEKAWAPVYFAENWEDREGFDPYICLLYTSKATFATLLTLPAPA